MREGLREIGRGTLGLAKYLLGNVLLVAVIFAGVLLIGFAFGIVSRVDRWIRQHNISPTLLIAVTAFVTVQIMRGDGEQSAGQQRPRRPFDRDPDPPYPAG
jgi:hypothetical protein